MVIKMDIFTERFSRNKSAQEMIQANAAADAAKMEQLQGRIAEYESLLQDMRRVNLKAAENMEQMHNIIKEALGKIEAVKTDRDAAQEKEELLLAQLPKQMEEFASRIKEQMEELEPQIKSRTEELGAQIKEQIGELEPQIKKQTEELGAQIKEQIGELEPQITSRTEALEAQMKKQSEELGMQIKGQSEELEAQMKYQTEELGQQIREQIEDAFERSEDFLHKDNVKVYRNVQAAVAEVLDKQTEVLALKQQESAKKQKALLPVSIIIMLMVIVDIAVNLFNIVIKL